jgi:hypothetical protein
MSGRSGDQKKTTCSRTAIIGPVLLLLLATSSAFAIRVPRGMDTCPSLNVCLQLLDAVVPATDDGEGSNSEVLARDLSRFGDAAKHELLNRATGNQPGWRNVAGAILSDWPSWDPSDVPALRKALQRGSRRVGGPPSRLNRNTGSNSGARRGPSSRRRESD